MASLLRNSLIVLSIFFSKSTLYAQLFDKGPSYTTNNESIEPEIIGEDDSSVYVIDVYRDWNNVPYLLVESFDKVSLERKYSESFVIPMMYLGKKGINRLESVTFLDGVLYYFLSSTRLIENEERRTSEYISELIAFGIDGNTGSSLPPDTIIRYSSEGSMEVSRDYSQMALSKLISVRIKSGCLLSLIQPTRNRNEFSRQFIY